MVDDMRAMERTLKSRAYPGLGILSTLLENEHHLTVPPVSFTRALMAVLPAAQGEGQRGRRKRGSLR